MRRSGDVIADAIDKVGKDGVVTSRRADVRHGPRVHRGMQFDKGYISPYMVTDQDRMERPSRTPTS